MVLREVATLSRLQHQHIVRYYQVIISADVYCFKMKSFYSTCGQVWHLSLRCQAWVETEYGHHNILNAGGSRTAESSIFSYDDISLSDAGGGNKQESTYLYIQMEYCPRCVSLRSYALSKAVLRSLHQCLFCVNFVEKLLLLEPYIKILL